MSWFLMNGEPVQYHHALFPFRQPRHGTILRLVLKNLNRHGDQADSLVWWKCGCSSVIVQRHMI